MKKFKKLLSNILILVILITNTQNVFANENIIEKEEIVYANIDNNGNVKEINVVNVLKGGDIIDYGEYSDVKALNIDDKINIIDDTIKFHTENDVVYYQGTMKNKELPWNISIKYFLDDKEYFKNSIVGKTGKLKLKINIDKNKNIKESFYESFALQVNIVFNTENTKNINAKDATITNVGKKKQLVYTVFPDKGLKTEILADVEDFEMDPIQINGIKINLNIDTDTKEIKNKANDLKNGINKINNASEELKEGANKAKNGVSNLKNSSYNFKNGVSSLDNGIIKLKNGTEKLEQGIDTLNGKSEILLSSSTKMKEAIRQIKISTSKISSSTNDIKKIIEASDNIKKSIEKLYLNISKLKDSISYNQYKESALKNNLDIEKIKESNIEAINDINNQIKILQDNLRNTNKDSETMQINKQIEQLKSMISLINLNNVSISFTENYLDGINSSISQLLSGSFELKNKYNEFDLILQNIFNTLSNMNGNMSKLSEAMSNIYEQYNLLDDGLIEYTNGVNNISIGFKELKKGILEVSGGSKTLKNGSNEMFNGINNFDSNFNKFYDGILKLNNGAHTLKNKTNNIDNKIEDKINEIVPNNKDKKIESFVSEKNKNVKSVQFIIKTDPIEKEKIKKDNVKKEEDNFWEKLSNLFKSNKK